MLAPIFTESNPALLNQTITVTTMNGIMKYNLQDFDEFQRSRMILAALFGARASVSALVSIILFLMADRRTTPVYIFNQVSLIFFFIQSTLFLVSSFSPFGLISTIFTFSYASVTTTNVNISLAGSVFQLLFVITIQCSLFFQGRIVFPKQSRSRLLATLVLGTIALGTIIIYSLNIAQSCTFAVNPVRDPLFPGRFGKKLPSIAQIMFASSITVSMLIFVGKLVFAIRTRWVLGLKQFGPLQIICIMGAQSMIIPAVLTVISFARTDVKNVYSVAPLIVVISLPLSAMWAASANTSTSPSSTANYSRGGHHNHHHHHSGSSSRRYSPGSYDLEKQENGSHESSSSALSNTGFLHRWKHAVLSLFVPRSAVPDLATRRHRAGPPPIDISTASSSRQMQLESGAGEDGRGGGYLSGTSFDGHSASAEHPKYTITTRVSLRNSGIESFESEEDFIYRQGQAVGYLPDTPMDRESPLAGECKGMGIIMGSDDGHPSVNESKQSQEVHIV